MAKYYTFFNKYNGKILGVVNNKHIAESIIEQRKDMPDLGVIIEKKKDIPKDLRIDFEELSEKQVVFDFEGVYLFHSEEDVQYLLFPDAISDMYTTLDSVLPALNFIKFTEEEQLFIDFLVSKINNFIGDIESEDYEGEDRYWGPSVDSEKLTLSLVEELMNPTVAKKRIRETLD